MVRMVERKVRERAQQLYDERGQEDGRALQDWFQAESEVLENTIVAPLYRKLRGADKNQLQSTPTELSAQESAC